MIHCLSRNTSQKHAICKVPLIIVFSTILTNVVASQHNEYGNGSQQNWWMC